MHYAFSVSKKKHPPQSYCEIWHDQQGLFSFMAVPQLQGLLAARAYQVIQRSWPISFPKNQSTNSSDSNFTIIIRIFLNDFALSTHHCILISGQVKPPAQLYEVLNASQ